MEDILYYSNHCLHSKKVLQYVYKNNLIGKISCICVDQQSRNPSNNSVNIVLENGRTESLPPCIQTVPTIMRPSQKYTLVLGCSQILEHFQEHYTNSLEKESTILQQNLEPVSSNGLGSSIFMEIDKSSLINAQDEIYESGKLSGDTIEMLIQERNNVKFPDLRRV